MDRWMDERMNEGSAGPGLHVAISTHGGGGSGGLSI